MLLFTYAKCLIFRLLLLLLLLLLQNDGHYRAVPNSVHEGRRGTRMSSLREHPSSVVGTLYWLLLYGECVSE